jgi:molybdenum cofactor synthesis domain-containing protein
VALLAKIVTVSDSVSTGDAEDRSGAALATCLEGAGFEIVERRCIPDGVDSVAAALHELSTKFVGLVVTTGGTGFGPRDLTPEGTRAAIDREAPGIAEAMRLCDPLGRLSRSIAGTVGQTLILNTPGSPRGAVQCVEAVLDVVPHALALLRGENPHPHHAHRGSDAAAR